MGRSDTVRALQAHLQAATAARADATTGAQRARLRTWQSARLARTYADLLADPRYRPAAEFFLSDLYSSADHADRDAQMLRALTKLVRLLPEAALEALGLALEVDALSEQLDGELAAHLFGAVGDGPITDAAYTAAYRRADARGERERQIALVDSVGRTLDRIAHSPLLAGAVRMMRAPAQAAGLGSLQSFLERGLAAFQTMQGAAPFLDTVRSRELAILDRLAAGSDQPFDLSRPT